MVFPKLFATSIATSTILSTALILPNHAVSSTVPSHRERQASTLVKRSEPECLDGYGWADFHDCQAAIYMLFDSLPSDDLTPLLGAETYEFLGVGAPRRFAGFRSVQTPVKRISGHCVVNILMLDRGGTEFHQSSDTSTQREVVEAAYDIVGDCMLRQNAGGKMVVGDHDDMAVFVYAINSKFDRAEKLLNIDAYHPRDWVQLLEDHLIYRAADRIKAAELASQGFSGVDEGASTVATQGCSTGYSSAPESCCRDYSFSWKNMAAASAQILMGALSPLVDGGKFGWCEYVTSAMESTVRLIRRDFSAEREISIKRDDASTMLAKRNDPLPVCDRPLFGSPQLADCIVAQSLINFFEDLPDTDEVYEVARNQVVEFLAPGARPRFPGYHSKQTPRAWSIRSCEIAVLWRWTGGPASDLATEKQITDGAASVLRRCVAWGSGGYQRVGAESGIAVYLYAVDSNFKKIIDKLIAGQLKCPDPSNPQGLCTKPYDPATSYAPSKPLLPILWRELNRGSGKETACSRGYGNGPADCCEDTWFVWGAVSRAVAGIMWGATMVRSDGGVGWCAVDGSM